VEALNPDGPDQLIIYGPGVPPIVTSIEPLNGARQLELGVFDTRLMVTVVAF